MYVILLKKKLFLGDSQDIVGHKSLLKIVPWSLQSYVYTENHNVNKNKSFNNALKYRKLFCK